MKTLRGGLGVCRCRPVWTACASAYMCEHVPQLFFSAVNLFLTVISNQCGYGSAQKVTRSRRASFQKSSSTKLSRVLTAGTQTRQIILFLGSDYRGEAVRQNKHRIKRDLLGRSTKCCEAAGGEHIRDAARRYSTSRPVIRSDSAFKTSGWQNPADFSNLRHLKGNSINSLCDCRSFEEAACNLTCYTTHNATEPGSKWLACAFMYLCVRWLKRSRMVGSLHRLLHTVCVSVAMTLTHNKPCKVSTNTIPGLIFSHVETVLISRTLLARTRPHLQDQTSTSVSNKSSCDPRHNAAAR